MEDKIKLKNIGVKSNLKGFNYILEAISIIRKNEMTQMNEIYTHIVAKYNDTPSKIERAIRNAIEVAFIENNSLKSFYDKKPNNKVFLNDFVVFNGNFKGTVYESNKI